MGSRICSCAVLLVGFLALLEVPSVGLVGSGGTTAGGEDTLVVDNSGPCGGPGQPFCEIQDAIDAAGAGDTIEVRDGGPAYLPICIPAGTDDLEIEGDGDPIIDGGGVGTAVMIVADGVTLEDFEIRNAEIGVDVIGDDAEIEDCEIHDHIMHAVRIVGSGNEVEECELSRVDGPAVAILGDIGAMGNNIEDNKIFETFDEGILVCSTSFNTIDGNEIRDAGTFGNGIELFAAFNTTVRGNRVQGMCNGICLASSDDNKIYDNRCNDNVCNGISANPTSDGNWFEGNEADGNLGGNGFEICGELNVLCENSAEENADAGFFVNGPFNCLMENEAEGNGEDGFEILSGTGNLFEENRAEENGGSGFHVLGSPDPPAGNLFEDNEAEDNGGFGFLDETTGGSGDFGTDNFYDDNECDDNGAGDADPEDICDD